MKLQNVPRRRGIGRNELRTLFVCLCLVSTFFVLVTPVNVKAATWVCVDDDAGPWCDYTVIQEAINNIDVGGTISVYEGTYIETLTISKSLNLIGNSSANTTINPNPVRGGTGILVEKASTVHISGFLVKEDGKETFKGIRVIETSTLNISECRFENLGEAIVAEGGGILHVENNSFYRHFNRTDQYYAEYPKAVSMRWGGPGTGPAGNGNLSTIVNNTIEFKDMGHAIHENYTAISLIENNTIIQNATNYPCTREEGLERDAAIVLYQWSTGGSSTIRYNSIDNFCWGISTEGAVATIDGGWINNTARGIGLARRGEDVVDTDLTIEDIHVNQSSQYGIISAISSTLTLGNSSVTNSSVGIHILHSTTASIYQCNISHNGVGVKTYEGTSTQASNSVYFDNIEGFHSEGTDQVFHNQFFSNANGVRVQANSARNISNNTITGDSVAGIWVYHSSSDNKIQNNEVTQGYRGIWIWGASSNGNIVRWNNISDNHYGIHIESYEGLKPSSNSVERNNISFNEYGIYMRDARLNILRGNNISGNRNSGIYLDSVESISIEESNISNNFIGIFLTGDSVLISGGSFPPVYRNSILGNTLWAIDSSIPGDLDAWGNFFGAWNNDTIDEIISGSVIFHPWLGFRESNVDIVTSMYIVGTFPPRPHYIEKGMIVNGSLAIGPGVIIEFNNSLGQNFIQINGVMGVHADSTFSSNYGNFTIIYLNGSQGSISQSTFEGQMGVSIQSTHVSVADSYLKNGTNGLIINQGENNTISRSGMTQNRNNGTYLFSSFWNDFTDNEILRNGDFGIRLDSSENNSISGRNVSTSDISCVYLSDSVNNTVALLNITSCLHGIYSESSENNVYSSNNISSNDYGIQLVSDSENSTVLQSNISNNFVGITVNSSYPSHINNNSILGNVFYAISSPVPLLYLDAEYNYFGTNDSGQIAKLVTSYVDYDPWLPFRESNVTYIDNYTEWTTNQTLQGGIVVNETGCLNITGTQQNEVMVTFNSIHRQNYIQVNNATNLNNTVLQTGSGPYTLLFLESSNSRIENSNVSNFMGIGIQSEEQRLSSNQGIYVVNDSFFQSAYGLVLHRANNTLIEESTVISNEHFGLLLHSSKQVDMGPNNSVSYNRRG
ncbi:MAG: right-handed parallel beta-helix repeat-containing protein, partial [Candidatus Thorarchaeota archaeon]